MPEWCFRLTLSKDRLESPWEHPVRRRNQETNSPGACKELAKHSRVVQGMDWSLCKVHIDGVVGLDDWCWGSTVSHC